MPGILDHDSAGERDGFHHVGVPVEHALAHDQTLLLEPGQQRGQMLERAPRAPAPPRSSITAGISSRDSGSAGRSESPPG